MHRRIEIPADYLGFHLSATELLNLKCTGNCKQLNVKLELIIKLGHYGQQLFYRRFAAGGKGRGGGLGGEVALRHGAIAVSVAVRASAGRAGLAQQVSAPGSGAREAFVSGRFGGVKNRVRLGEAGSARLALQPRQVAAGVDDDAGLLWRCAQFYGDDELSVSS